MRRLKKFLMILCINVFVLGSCLIGFNVRGYEYQIDSFNYSPYKYVGKLTDITYNNNVVTSLDFNLIAEVNGNVLNYYDTPAVARIEYNESDYLATYNELIDTTVFTINEVYMINGSDIEYLKNLSLINVYYNYVIYNYHSLGYTSGINQTDVNEAYNNGYNAGIVDKQSAIDNAIAQNNQNHQVQIDSLNSEIERLKGLLNEESPSWANFKNLLSTIFMFPINFFKEAFGVDIWGINIGYFIIGIFMIAITITLIGIFRRGKNQ